MLLVVLSGASSADDVPLSAYTEVRAPNADVPPEYAAYSGIWYGVWRGSGGLGRLHHVLVVKEISSILQTPVRASVIYVWGTAPRWNIEESGWDDRIWGTFSNGRLVFYLTNALGIKTTVIYRMQADGTLRGSYQPKGSHAVWVTMRRRKE